MDYFVKKSEKWSVEPEEILLDPQSAEKLDDSKFELPIEAKNFLILFWCVALALGLFAVRAGWMQVAGAQKYEAAAASNKTRNYPILARRGIVYDRDLRPLVENVPSFDLVTIPADLPRNKEERRELIARLAPIIDVPEALLAEQFARVKLAQINPALIMENVARDTALFLETKLDLFPGIEIKKNSYRLYADGAYFSHVMGYVGRVSENDLERDPGFSSIDYVGKSGVELSYDRSLRGSNGIIEREVDAISDVRKEKQVAKDAAGETVVLTIDGPLQKKLTDALARQLAATEGADGASAVALDPQTGEILALVSLPSYDNNIFGGLASRESYRDVRDDPKTPLFDRAVFGQYPPGSSIKPFIAAMALQEGVITSATTVVSTGSISVPNQYNPDIVYTFHDWKTGGHGLVNVIKALSESVNTFFYTVGGGHGDIAGLGISRIKEYLGLFGFGGATGVDLAGENNGTVPDPAWKKEVLREGWSLGDTYNTSIGQGNLLVTPLQLAQGYAALANGGTLFRPFVVKSVLDKDKRFIMENKSQAVRASFIDAKNLDTVRKGMRETVLSGTARPLSSLPVAVAGKTGTAQAGQNKTHAWFSSFAPYNDPSIVLVVLVENGGEGSVVSVPVAHEVLQWYFTRK